MPEHSSRGTSKETTVADKLPPDKTVGPHKKENRKSPGLSFRGRWLLVALAVSIAVWVAIAAGLAKLL